MELTLAPGRAQAIDAVLVKQPPPGNKFIDGKIVAAARLVERDQPAQDTGDDLGFAPDDPTPCIAWRQIVNRHRLALGVENPW